MPQTDVIPPILTVEHALVVATDKLMNFPLFRRDEIDAPTIRALSDGIEWQGLAIAASVGSMAALVAIEVMGVRLDSACGD